MRNFLLLLAGLILTINGFSQSDTEFWFAGPENESNNGLRDRPLYIRVATFNLPATVTLSQPARPQFTPITVDINANSTYTFDLQYPTDFTDVIETKPQNQVLNYGLKLTSTNPITAYYEQSSSSNPDIFTLKGRNALGTRFIVPFQTTYYNSQRTDLGGTKFSWFVVVATEDNTHVTIKPTVAIEGHVANVPFTVTLNKGQTYACRSIGQSPAEHAAGTLITSDKPIAVTTNDDSVCQCQSCTNIGPDLIGDQIISYNVFGKEHIIVKGYFTVSGSSQSADRIYVFADSANTALYINGTYVSTINNPGEFYTYNFGDENVIYLSASKP
ncbi:MAG TPA: IgGFc-binding protein, partial [Bacteroidales bacterium]|nr:IgGFc-binding protein [Bacteroidales bacterium]